MGNAQASDCQEANFGAPAGESMEVVDSKEFVRSKLLQSSAEGSLEALLQSAGEGSLDESMAETLCSKKPEVQRTTVVADSETQSTDSDSWGSDAGGMEPDIAKELEKHNLVQSVEAGRLEGFLSQIVSPRAEASEGVAPKLIADAESAKPVPTDEEVAAKAKADEEAAAKAKVDAEIAALFGLRADAE